MIAREGGVRGMWKGWVPNVQRAALVNLGGMWNKDGFETSIFKAKTKASGF